MAVEKDWTTPLIDPKPIGIDRCRHCRLYHHHHRYLLLLLSECDNTIRVACIPSTTRIPSRFAVTSPLNWVPRVSRVVVDLLELESSCWKKTSHCRHRRHRRHHQTQQGCHWWQQRQEESRHHSFVVVLAIVAAFVGVACNWFRHHLLQPLKCACCPWRFAKTVQNGRSRGVWQRLLQS